MVEPHVKIRDNSDRGWVMVIDFVEEDDDWLCAGCGCYHPEGYDPRHDDGSCDGEDHRYNHDSLGGRAETASQHYLDEGEMMNIRAEAAKLGEEHARNAASWVVDGNTKTEFIPAVLRMMAEGDPAVWDYLPAMPGLSGEWADGLTPRSLAEELGFDPDTMGDHYIDAMADAYEEAVSETFESRCEEILREALAED